MAKTQITGKDVRDMDLTDSGSFVPPSATSDPDGVPGRVYYNMSTGKYRGYQDGQWVDIGSIGAGSSLALTPGTYWELAKAVDTTKAWQAVAYGNGTWVALFSASSHDVFMSSTDGINWVLRSIPPTGSHYPNYKDIVYAQNMFVAVGNSENGTYPYGVARSSDGETWSYSGNVFPGTNRNPQKVTYGGGKFLALGSSGTFIYSYDAITWYETARPEGAAHYDLTYSEDLGLFCVVGDTSGGRSAGIVVSSNGIDWTTDLGYSGGTLKGVAAGGGKLVAVGSGEIAYSSNGTSWTKLTGGNIANYTWTSIAYGNGLFVAVASSGSETTTSQRVLTSPDGVTWTRRNAISEYEGWLDVAYGDRQFVAVGNSGQYRVMVSGILDRHVVSYNEGNASPTSLTETDAVLRIHGQKISPPAGIEIRTTTTTLTLNENGRTFYNSGAVTYKLPASPEGGEQFTFCCLNSGGTTVTATGSAQIRVGASITAANGSISSTTVGGTITLRAISSTLWMAVSVYSW